MHASKYLSTKQITTLKKLQEKRKLNNIRKCSGNLFVLITTTQLTSNRYTTCNACNIYSDAFVK